MNRLVSWFCKIFLAPLIKKLFIKKVEGLENIPNTNFILVANHQSHLDELATGYLCIPRRFRFIGQTDKYSGLNKVLLYITYFIGGVIRLNRKSEESKKRTVKKAIKSLKMGDILIIYPEGTRTRTGKMGKGKSGVAKIFLETGVPLLPVGIKGTFELLPPGGKLKIKQIVEIKIGKPLFLEKELGEAKNLDENSEEYRILLQKITDTMMGKIKELV